MNTGSYLRIPTFLISILFLLGCSSSNQSDETAEETSDESSESLPDNCYKAWSLEEIVEGSDSICYLALLGEHEKRLTAFPEILGTLPHLVSVDARDNTIKTIPKFLSKLEELYLGGNSLTECPSGLEHLTNLTTLDLSYNQITKLNDEIFSLNKLQEIRIGNNVLKEIPLRLFTMPNLKILEFRRNSVTTLPDQINQLTNLEELYLDENILELPQGLCQCKNLNTLYADSFHNSFEEEPGTLLSCIYDLENLTTLSLRNRNIGELPSDIARLKNLETLDLTDNKLTKLPEEIKSLKHLKYLRLANNKFEEEEQSKIQSWFGEGVYVEFEEEVGD